MKQAQSAIRTVPGVDDQSCGGTELSAGRWMFRRLLTLCLLVPSIAPLGTLIADEDEFQTGLKAVYSDSRTSVTRIDRQLNFDWTAATPDPRIQSDFTTTWSGNLLVRQPGRHTFHVAITGALSLHVNDQSVLLAEGEDQFISSEPVDLPAGDQPFKVQYRSQSRSAPRLQIFWSSPDFTLEPIPANALSIEPSDDPRIPSRDPRLLVDSLRCSACHAGMAEHATLKAPDLNFANDITDEAILGQLTAYSADAAEESTPRQMPEFRFTADEASSISAYLRSVARPASNRSLKAVKFEDKDADPGQKLLLTTGCVVCHEVPGYEVTELSTSNAYFGPSLKQLSQKRTAGWVMEWLKSPESLNPNHRMPVFVLTDAERRQLTAALFADKSAPKDEPETPSSSSDEQLAEGRKLIVAANCVSCHSIPGIELVADKLARPSVSKSDPPELRCIATSTAVQTKESGWRIPHYQLSEQQRNDIVEWLRPVQSDLNPAKGFSLGELLLHRNGCVACHDRDLSQGISRHASRIESLRDDLRGQSQALIPPPLTAAGDRMKDEVLEAAIAGEPSVRRLPWLLVRMPKFRHSPDERSAITQFLIGSDRIPDVADTIRAELFEHFNPYHTPLASPENLLTGNHLIGAAGFNCISCHKAGPFEPRNVAMGTRGSDIMLMGSRLRPRYFLRWMQNPIRVVPGIEMPALRKPVPGLLDDSLPQQIAMMWKALMDPRFSPPTVVSRYEQFVNVAPGEKPKIIRDVFTIGEDKDRIGVARAFAVGLENRHNLLIDLDTMHLRQWTIGEFARQRTEGKSWFWSMAGVPIQTATPETPFCRAVPEGWSRSMALSPVVDEKRQAELLSYDQSQNQITLRVRFHFDVSQKQSPTDRSVDETRSPHSPLTEWNNPERPLSGVILRFELSSAAAEQGASSCQVTAHLEEAPAGWRVLMDGWLAGESQEPFPSQRTLQLINSDGAAAALTDTAVLETGWSVRWTLTTQVTPAGITPLALPELRSQPEQITVVPGFTGQRLPISTALMPTAMTWLDDGRLAIASLRGQILLASDANGDSLPETLTTFAEGLAAPYGIQSDGDAILISHKPEILRLRDSDNDQRADQFDVVASGWGYSDDYHDWTTGLVRDVSGNLYVGLGSDYSQNKRPADNDRWRGTVLRIDTTGSVHPMAMSFRFPMGLAFDSQQRLFVTDNQGVQNTFNEINHVRDGKHYGVPSRHEITEGLSAEPPALMVPHPWTRSVNSLTFFPNDFAVPELAGHGIGCEYDTRCLIRFTTQEVNGELQGACYRFSLPDQPGGGPNFVGPVASALGPDGALYIGSIWDSGWQGGTNTGAIERLIPGRNLPNGIREIRATKSGFEVLFFDTVDPAVAGKPENWSLQGYTRTWGGSYATPDSDRYPLTPQALTLSTDQTSVQIAVGPLKSGYVYEISFRHPAAADGQPFWPSEGHYSMNQVPSQ
jgi:mono/diheme cytochrome c family protein